MVSEGYDSLDGPWNLSNAVQVSELKNLIWTRVILTVLSSLGPLHLMLADTPLPRGFGATLASVGTLSKGSRTVRCLPALPCRLRAMGRTV